MANRRTPLSPVQHAQSAKMALAIRSASDPSYGNGDRQRNRSKKNVLGVPFTRSGINSPPTSYLGYNSSSSNGVEFITFMLRVLTHLVKKAHPMAHITMAS